MSLIIRASNREFYRDTLQAVAAGEVVSPRGMKTAEQRNVLLDILDPAACVPVGTGRKLAMPVGSTEYVHMLAGISSVTQLDAASGNRFTQFAADGKLSGAYGPRAYNQWYRVIQLLTTDPYTRQASVVLLTGKDPGRSKDVPCTVSLSFFIRHGILDLDVHMRSNDAWLGLPYDVWVFTRIQMTLAWALGIPVGTYTHFANTLHLYEGNPTTEQLHAVLSKGAYGGEMQPPAITGRDAPGLLPFMKAYQRWTYARAAAVRIAISPQIAVSTSAGIIDEDVVEYYLHYVPDPEPGHQLCDRCRYYLPAATFFGGNMCDTCADEVPSR